MKETESCIINFILKSEREKDVRPYWKKIAETTFHNIKVIKKRLAPVK